ncbi:MAG: hypothetical protein U0518_04775 [Candidatus Gracilibacteria bacterium]
MSRTNIISYPGITAEAVPLLDPTTGQFLPAKHAYEAVLNCGGFSVMPTQLATTIATKSATHLKEEHKIDAIGYISDERVLNHPNFLSIREVFERFFGNHIHTFATTISKQENNPFGLRVNSTQVCDDSSIAQFVQEHGDDGVILASIPMSDPCVAKVFDQLSASDHDTIAGKTLRNLALNRDRFLPTTLAQDMNGFIGSISSAEETIELFDTHPDTIIVLKSSQGSAGGTNTFIISPHQRAEFMRKIEQIHFPLLAYNFVQPFLITNQQGSIHSAHVRSFIVGDELVGGVIKFPGASLNRELFGEDGRISLDVFRKKKIEEVNKLLNSSSGLSKSMVFSHDGQFQGGSDGKSGILTLEDTQGLGIFGTSNTLLDSIEEIFNSTIPLVTTLQERVNKQLQLR